MHRLRALLGRTDMSLTPIEAAASCGATGRAGRPPMRCSRRRSHGARISRRSSAIRRRSAADARLQLAQGKIDYTLSAEFHRQAAPGSLTGNEWGLFVSAPMPLFNRNQGEVERAPPGSPAGGGANRGAEDRHHQRSAQRVGASTPRRESWSRPSSSRCSRRRATCATPPPIPTAAAKPASSSCSTRSATFNDTMQSYNEARAGVRAQPVHARRHRPEGSDHDATDELSHRRAARAAATARRLPSRRDRRPKPATGPAARRR